MAESSDESIHGCWRLTGKPSDVVAVCTGVALIHLQTGLRSSVEAAVQEFCRPQKDPEIARGGWSVEFTTPAAKDAYGRVRVHDVVSDAKVTLDTMVECLGRTLRASAFLKVPGVADAGTSRHDATEHARRLLTTSEAWRYCGFKSASGLKNAEARGLVRSAGRRGGSGEKVWAVEELDRYGTGREAGHGQQNARKRHQAEVGAPVVHLDGTPAEPARRLEAPRRRVRDTRQGGAPKDGKARSDSSRTAPRKDAVGSSCRTGAREGASAAPCP